MRVPHLRFVIGERVGAGTPVVRLVVQVRVVGWRIDDEGIPARRALTKLIRRAGER